MVRVQVQVQVQVEVRVKVKVIAGLRMAGLGSEAGGRMQWSR